MTDADGIAFTFDEIHSRLQSINHLLCFAGIVGCVHAIEMPPAQWRKLLDVNTTGSFLCAQAAAKYMIEQGTGGSIMFTASISAHTVNFPQPQAGYNVSKAAVKALKSSLAAEWAMYGIRVNSLSPGYMDTILNEGAGLEEARRTWCQRNPMGRMGALGELDGVVVLLCSGAGSYITGADYLVDGMFIFLFLSVCGDASTNAWLKSLNRRCYCVLSSEILKLSSSRLQFQTTLESLVFLCGLI